MQGYMDFIFAEVWMKAYALGDFDISLFDSSSELQEIINYLYLSDTSPEYGKKFVASIKNIFDICKTLSCRERCKLSYWYKVNNRIENLCNGKHKPVLYTDLVSFNQDLARELKSIYDNLYSQNKIGLAEIAEHYPEFVKTNDKCICPFCGIQPMDGILSKTREAYDHFLPKSKYPFTSINLKNLAPMCNKCNSGNKGVKNPIFDDTDNRRKAFYPFTATTDIKIEVNLTSSDIQNLNPNDIDITITSIEQDKADTWQELFRIDERFKALLCEADGKSWVNEIISDAPDFGMDSSTYLSIKKKQFKENPYKEKNFLKIPFLEACNHHGVFT